ncbi:MAG: RDD family protein [Synergistaceae bacterium]|jgi:uncharacterized RDD family membrane protein YckC|nr:RDD family protein [Synergistaceae bacterium]
MTDVEGRLSALIEGVSREQRSIETPEGVSLRVALATRMERVSAFLLDMAFMGAAVFCLCLLIIPLFFSGTDMPIGMTLILFLAFIVRILYFTHFELAWQGATPGKKICGLRVINRSGGPLAPSAVIARNLTREVEFFLPLGIFLSLDASLGVARQLALLGWTCAIAALPLFNRDHLRAGDIIGGTVVISMPKRALKGDLSERGQSADGAAYAFSPSQLAIYGAFELQALEELLRHPPSDLALEEVCGKIRRKIGYAENIERHDVRRFLGDFYAAERAALEHGQLFGHFKADKTSASEPRAKS